MSPYDEVQRPSKSIKGQIQGGDIDQAYANLMAAIGAKDMNYRIESFSITKSKDHDNYFDFKVVMGE